MSRFEGLKLLDHRKLTPGEMIRAVRKSIVEEIKAVELYEQFTEASDNKDFIKVMTDVTNEERRHIGEFLRLLLLLDKIEGEEYEKGGQEVDNLLKKK